MKKAMPFLLMFAVVFAGCDVFSEDVALEAPADLHIISASGESISLRWTDNAEEEDGYILERSVGIDGAYRRLDSLGVNSYGYIDNNVDPCEMYYYRVKAVGPNPVGYWDQQQGAQGGAQGDQGGDQGGGQQGGQTGTVSQREYSDYSNVAMAIASSPPQTPHNPSPANGATLSSLFNLNDETLVVNCTAGGDVELFLYFGTVNPPPPLDTYYGDQGWAIPDPQPETTYYWQVVALGECSDDSVAGPVWSFVTGPGEAPSGSAIVNGHVIDATNGEPVAGAEISANYGNVTITDSNGDYTFEVPSGIRTIRASMSGYDDATATLNLNDGETVTSNFTLSPSLGGGAGEMRFILSWGETPRDLDSHLKTPPIEGTEYHIYFADRGSASNPPYAELDLDDVTSYGPETITIYDLYTGTYKYFVYNWSDEAPLAGCGAEVEAYDESGLVRTVEVPATGDGRFWHVFNIEGGDIVLVNQISDVEPEPGFADWSLRPKF